MFIAKGWTFAWRRVASAVVLLGLVLAAPAAAQEAERPNVLFLYTDDQARWGMGAYGNPEAVTPHMDRIAEEGALLLNAFVVTPVCSPSRAGLFTGRWPTQVGIDDWIHPRREPELGLDPAELTWPELLKAWGYQTGLFGKWHLGTEDHYHPTRQGFDTFYGFRAGGNRPIDATLEVEGVERTVEGPLPDRLTDAALDFIETHRARPWLAAVHFRAPHGPYAPVPPEDQAPFAALEPTIPDVEGLPTDRVRQLTREYLASIHSVDRNVGRLLEALERFELTDRTIVIFTSDHGYMIGHHGLHHKGNATVLTATERNRRVRRPNMFEESIRVPLAVRWPGRVEPGAEIETVVSNLDLFPTLLALVGLETPPNLAIAGRDFSPFLLDPNTAIDWDDTLFGQYDMHHGRIAHMRMIRTPEWKLVRHFEPSMPDELYDLRHDPEERENLAKSPAHAARFERLNQRLLGWMASIDDPLLEGPDESDAADQAGADR